MVQMLALSPLLFLAPTQVMAAVGMKSGGPALGRLMEAAVEWQLAHPDGTAEQCREHLVAQHAAAQQAAGME